MARDKGSDEIEDLNGLAASHPALATCVTLLMLSLIGMPPLAGFFGKVSMFMEALREPASGRLTLLWLVGLGLLNSVVSAFYYVRVLKAMFLRNTSGRVFGPVPSPVALSIVLATVVSLGFGIYPSPLVEVCAPASVQMLSEGNLMGRLGVSRTTKPGPRSQPEPDVSRLRGASPGGGTTPPASPPAEFHTTKTQPETATKKAAPTPGPDAKSQAKGKAGASK